MRRFLLLCLLGISTLGYAQTTLPISSYKDYLIMRNGMRIDCSLPKRSLRFDGDQQLTYECKEGRRQIPLDSLSEIGKGKTLVYRRQQVYGLPAEQEATASQTPRDWQWLRVLEKGAAATLYAPVNGDYRYYYQCADGPVYELLQDRIPSHYRKERRNEVGMFGRYYQVQLWDDLRYPGQRPLMVASTDFSVKRLRHQVIAYNLHADSTYVPPVRMPERLHHFRIEGRMGLGIYKNQEHMLLYVGLRGLSVPKKRSSYSVLTELWFIAHDTAEWGFSVGTRYVLGRRGWWVASSLGPAFRPIERVRMELDVPGLGIEPTLSGMLEVGYGLKRWNVSLQGLHRLGWDGNSLQLHVGYKLY